MIIEQIENDFQQAFKNREEAVVSTLRMVMAALKNESINKRADLDEADALKILKSEIKKRKEALEEFEKGNRQDLADKEKSELKILAKYLPEQLSEDELKKIVKVTLDKIEDKSNLGKVMGMVMKELKDKADGNLIRKIVEQELGK